MATAIVAVAASLELVGCGGGDEVSGCDNLLPVTVSCDAALRFAARSADEIAPRESDIDDYYQRWTATIEAEPILANRTPQTYRLTPWITASIFTRNQSIISSWSSGNITTGVAQIDNLVSELVRPRLGAFSHDNGDGSYYFLVDVDGIYSEEILNTRLENVDAWLPAPMPHSGDDGTWTWMTDGSSGTRTARIEFKFGWGDCLVACDGYRTLVSIVEDDGHASVYDAGGDPLPEGMALSSNTLPISELP